MSIGSRTVNRRCLTLAAAGGLLLAGRGAPGAASQESSPSAGWSFTDDHGVTVELPELPARILADVNAAAPLWDFGIRPQGVFGWNVYEDGTFGVAGGNVDPSQVTTTGNVSEPFQLEPAIAFDPDLIVTITWAPDDPLDYWSIDADILPQVQEIAPIAAISAVGRADVNTRRFAELASALGADLTAPELVEANSRFETAIEDLAATASTRSDLSVLFFSAGPEGLVVANPPDWADLNFYLESGVNAILPDTAPGTFWQELSLEQALTYPSDIIMASERPGSFQLAELQENPVYSQHPAVKAGQVYGWNQDFIMSYQGMSDAIEHLVAVLDGAQKAT